MGSRKYAQDKPKKKSKARRADKRIPPGGLTKHELAAFRPEDIAAKQDATASRFTRAQKGLKKRTRAGEIVTSSMFERQLLNKKRKK